MGRKEKRETRTEQRQAIGEQKTTEFELGSASNKKTWCERCLACGHVNSKGLQRATSITEEDIYVVSSELHTAGINNP